MMLTEGFPKDVACLMGIIPEDEHMIGCECAGVVRRLGSNTMKFRIGDRVVVQGQGNYANRVQSIAHCVQVIPAWMTFEDAATMPLVYTTALRSLFHLGNLQQHQVSQRRASNKVSLGWLIANQSHSPSLSILLPVGSDLQQSSLHSLGMLTFSSL